MPTKPLPPRPNLDFDRKQAKQLLAGLRAGEPEATRRLREFHPAFKEVAPDQAALSSLKLSDAQLVIAREYGFESWPKLKERFASRRAEPSQELVEKFKAAVAAGDATALDALLDESPELGGKIDAPLFPADQPAIVYARNNRQVVEVLLKHGADVNARSQFWARPVGVLDDVDADTADWFIRRGAVADIGAFVSAVRAGNVTEVDEMLSPSAPLRAQINKPLFAFGGRAIHQAKRNRALTEVLIRHGADVRLKSDWWAGGFGVLDGVPQDMTEFFLDKGAPLDVFAAAEHGRLDALKALIAADPSLVHAKGGDGQRPLHYAAMKEIIDFLLDHGAEIDARCVDHASTAAQYAVRTEWKVRYLIERGASIDVFMAAALGDVALVDRALREHPNAAAARTGKGGYPPCPPDAAGTIYQWKLGTGLSPHQVALKFGHREAYEALLAHSTPQDQFLAACAAGNEPLARSVLSRHPAVSSSLSPEQFAQLGDAAFARDVSAVRLMLDLGFPLDTRDVEQSTPLHRAALRGYVDVVNLLLERRAPLELKNVYGATPLGMCLWGSLNFRDASGDYPRTAERLLVAGAVAPEKPWGSPECQEVLRSRGT